MSESGRDEESLENLEIGQDDLIVTAPLDGASMASTPWMPARIGNCRVLRMLGAGGMGMVFLARQDEPRRNVAIKVLGPSASNDSLLRRFRRESEALALLHHPGVAQIFDVGVDESSGRKIPYIIMELIEGEPLNQFARQRELPRREVLELAARVCDAVEHAHQKGVIHRDLKPGNILVEESGQPKVLDFGIARITQDETLMTRETEAGQLLGTVAYMSPEQAAGEPTNVDTRSDVYSLGVVLYELLAGRLPHAMEKASILEIARIIREDEPAQLSSIDARLRGDVETIVGKALEKDKERRYQSAGEFAEDIRRHLTDKPIAAHPPSTMYQLKKFARRNRALVTGVAAVFVTLIAGLIATGVALAKESDARKDAEASLERSDAATDFLESALLSVTPIEAAGRDTELMRLVLDKAAASVDEKLAAHPEIRAEMLSIVGGAYRRISEFELSLGMFERSLEVYGDIREDDDPDRIRVLYSLAGLLREIGESDEAMTLIDAGLAALSETGENPRLTSDLLCERAQLQISRGDYEDALLSAEEAVAVVASVGNPVADARTRSVRGNALRRIGRLDEAYEDYLFVRQVYESKEHFSILDQVDTLNSIAIIHRSRGEEDAAAQTYRRAISLRRELDTRPDQLVAVMMLNFGRVLIDMDELEEAATYVADSVEMHRALFGDEHYGTAIAIASNANILAKQEKYEEALALYDESRHTAIQLLGPNHPHIVTMLIDKSAVLKKLKRYGEAESGLRQSLQIIDERDLPAATYRAITLLRLAEILYLSGRIEEADRFGQKAVTCLPENDPRRESYSKRLQDWRERAEGMARSGA